MSDLERGMYFASPAALAEHLSEFKWVRTPHLTLISKLLVRAAMGELPRLMVFAPPRHGKSQLVSLWFPIWFLALFPHKRVILTSYGAEFAREWGRQVRNTMNANWPELGITVAEDSKAAHRWHTHDGGGMVTAGVGGEITGRGADLLIIDDPVKNAEEAQSETYRQRAWDWWLTTARTRLEPGGIVVVVQTRWHEDDLAGKMLSDGSEDWQVVSLPALAEKGDILGRALGQALWPERYDEKALEQTRRTLKDYNFSALYQQRPAPAEGGLLKRAWFKNYYDELPTQLDKILFSWDCTFKDADTSDYVVGQAWGIKGSFCYLLDQVRDQWDITITVKQVKALRAKWMEMASKLLRDPDTIPRTVIEDKANGPAVISTLRHEIPGLMGWPPKGRKMSSKESRVQAIAPLLEAGQVLFPRGQAFSESIENEAAAFPNAAYDDQIDCLSQALLNLQPALWNPADPPKPQPTNLSDLRRQQMLDAIAANLKGKGDETIPGRFGYLNR